MQFLKIVSVNIDNIFHTVKRIREYGNFIRVDFDWAKISEVDKQKLATIFDFDYDETLRIYPFLILPIKKDLIQLDLGVLHISHFSYKLPLEMAFDIQKEIENNREISNVLGKRVEMTPIEKVNLMSLC